MTAASDYDYDLPQELIAQFPLENRADARLMVIDRESGSIEHTHVRDLPDYLERGDALVTNDSRVIPATLSGYRTKTRGRWQGLFLDADEHGLWRMLCRTRGKMQPGETVMLVDREARDHSLLTMVAKLEDGQWAAKPECEGTPWDLLGEVGRVPLPHYIRGGRMVSADFDTYQTVYAKQPGSVAAPTAGLHFSKLLLEKLSQKVHLFHVTLHVGLGTFRPVASEILEDHKMHNEWGELTAVTAQGLQTVRDQGNKVIAVGTTSVRVLETVALSSDKFIPWSGETNLFIRPPFRFEGTDALMTNFHLPRSTLLVLVRTFGGDELIRQAYRVAIEEQYRFYSYGDAMLIL
jgi:S-adenosylmethionine:tRNA ribosyltransferase-isomerase